MKRSSILVAAAALALSACASIPKQNLDNYVANFNTAKATAQDMYLAAQVHAEKKFGEGTEVDKVKLAEKTRAFRARLSALDIIDKYNSALVRLATGTDPAGVRADLEGLSTGLKSFSVSQLSSLVGSVAPYLTVISQAIALIDDAIKAERFAEAVAAAQRPIHEIVEILIQDADLLSELQVQAIERARDRDHQKLVALHRKMTPLVRSLNAEKEVTEAVSAFNAALAREEIEPTGKLPPVTLAPRTVPKPAATNPSAAAASAAAGPAADAPKLGAPIAQPPKPVAPKPVAADEKALLQTIVNQTNALVDSQNQSVGKIKAEEKLVAEYKKALEACNASLADLHRAIKEGRHAQALALAINVLNLRKAYIEVREAK